MLHKSKHYPFLLVQHVRHLLRLALVDFFFAYHTESAYSSDLAMLLEKRPKQIDLLFFLGLAFDPYESPN
ncbi:MAG: hypothetical protein EBR34_15575 [Sphingomonadaceae bacterium]|nr:hypothetical protein [Sphingomonadaceae bacterium]